MFGNDSMHMANIVSFRGVYYYYYYYYYYIMVIIITIINPFTGRFLKRKYVNRFKKP